MKLLLAKTTVTTSLMATALHFMAHGVMTVEDQAKAYIDAKYTHTIAGLARDMGFIKPVVLAPKTRNSIIAREMKVNEISPLYASIFAGLIQHESRGKVDATSYQDARGLAQVLHSNAKYCGFTKDELYDEEKNIICGVRLFAEALKHQNYNLINALKEYHGGPDKKQWGAKTNAYPNLVLTALSKVK